jgi:thiosulfate reductase cytochrome b subunit
MLHYGMTCLFADSILLEALVVAAGLRRGHSLPMSLFGVCALAGYIYYETLTHRGRNLVLGTMWAPKQSAPWYVDGMGRRMEHTIA